MKIRKQDVAVWITTEWLMPEKDVYVFTEKELLNILKLWSYETNGNFYESDAEEFLNKINDNKNEKNNH